MATTNMAYDEFLATWLVYTKNAEQTRCDHSFSDAGICQLCSLFFVF